MASAMTATAAAFVVLLLVGAAAAAPPATEPAAAGSGAAAAAAAAAGDAPPQQVTAQQQQPTTAAAAAGHKHKHKHGGKKPAPNCVGEACAVISALLPQVAFTTPGQVVQCKCADFLAGKCFAPGCFVCNKACFGGDKELINAPGPLGTGLICSRDCLPCCQRADDPARFQNSTCVLLPGPGC